MVSLIDNGKMEKKFSISDLKSNVFNNNDCIVIPEYLLDILVGLCMEKVEYSGQLLCRKNIVEYPFISGVGGVASVFPTKKVVFNNSIEYTAIEYHTHSLPLGDFWTDKFSSGDLKTFENRILQEGEFYQHILFTNGNVLTWGKLYAPNVRIGFGNTELVKYTFDSLNEKYKSWDISTQGKIVK